MRDPGDLIAGLCGFARRAPCSDAERRAANWLEAELARRGHEAWVEPLWTRPQWAPSLALALALAVAASVVAVAAAGVGLALALAATVSLGLEAAGRVSPLRLPFPRRATQVVVCEPPDPAAIRLVLCASYDAPRRGLLFADRLRRLAARGRGPGPLGWLALAAGAIAAAAGARLAGVDATWLGALQLIPTIVCLLGLAAAIDIALSDVCTGASDPASGAAVAVALLDELAARPPAGVSPALLLAGSGETIPAVVAGRHLRAERLDPARAVVLELGACGAGVPEVAARHPGLRAAAAEAGVAPGRRAREPSRACRPRAWRAARPRDGLRARGRRATSLPRSTRPPCRRPSMPRWTSPTSWASGSPPPAPEPPLRPTGSPPAPRSSRAPSGSAASRRSRRPRASRPRGCA